MKNAIGQALDQAADHLAAHRYQAAHAALMAVLRSAPATAEAFYLLGILAADHQNHAKACELYDRAIALEPGNARYHADKARSLLARSQREQALEEVERAIAAGPATARTFDTVGVVLSRLGLHDRAVDFYRQATEHEPASAAFQYNLAAALQFLGEFEDAARAYRAALAIDPGHVKAWSSLVMMQKQTRFAHHIPELEALFPRLTDADDQLHIGHALAKAHEDLGDIDATMSWLARAKAGKRARAGHDEAAQASLFAAAATTAHLPAPSFAPSPDRSPILIVGMPRTGTTLLDRILSQHPDVVSAGELSDFAIALKHRARTSSPYVLDAETLHAAGQFDLTDVGAAYVARARQVVGPDVPRFIDKMPLNFFYSALVLRALPSARVICLRRNPVDAVLSNYRQMFATGFSYYAYNFDLAWTARFYASFDRLIAEFRKSLPGDRFTEVAYESIVADLEGEARRLLAFCGLSWDPRCLDFHENAAPVATASSAQVRQPLYSSSVGRWKRYLPHLGPVLEIFREEGIKVPE